MRVTTYRAMFKPCLSGHVYAVRILLGVATLTSNYDCSNFCSLQVMTCKDMIEGVANLAATYDCSGLFNFPDVTFLWFFNFFRSLNLKVFSKFEIPNPVVGYCESTLKCCKCSVQLRLLKCFYFPRCDVFYVILKVFKKLRYKKLHKI